MAEKTLNRIAFYQTLNSHGQLQVTPDAALLNQARLMGFYRCMLRTRLFDEKAVKLQRTGRLGTYASSLGQEAIGAALGAAMRDEDVLAPTYRDYAAQFSRGVTMAEILLYWGGDERGMNTGRAREDLPICVPIASHTTQAAGIAYAMAYRQQPRVCVCVIGDGGTSKGDFYEAINAAGVWNLPLVFIINNNQWAISMPREQQSGAETLAQKAIAAGLPGEQVDGNDVLACYERFKIAIDNARQGRGPALIEALTYRLCDHTTADDAQRYRSAEELDRQWHYEPIRRLKTFLHDRFLISDHEFNAIKNDCIREVDEQAQLYLDTAAAEPGSIFDSLYHKLPRALQAQRESVLYKHAHRREVSHG